MTAVKFRATPDGLSGIVVLSIKRNLPLTTKVSEFYATHVTRSSNAGPFAYHGGTVLKGGNEAQAAKPVFNFELPAQLIYTRKPDGSMTHANGVSAQSPTWVRLEWKSPPPEGKLTSLPVQVINITP